MSVPPGDPAAGPREAARLIADADLVGARAAIAGVVRRTPALASEELSAIAATPVALKAECLQVTGSFKLRGVLAKVAALGDTRARWTGHRERRQPRARGRSCRARSRPAL